MKIRRKMLAMILAVLTILVYMTMPIHAAVVEPDVRPMWENTATITLNLTFPDDGYAEASICGQFGVTKIVIDVYVYRQVGSSWTLVGEEHTTINGMAGSISCRFNTINRAYYRADYTFTVTKNNVDEIINETQSRTCVQ